MSNRTEQILKEERELARSQMADELRARLEVFIKDNRQITWEAEYEQGNFCIGEHKAREFFESIVERMEK